MTTFNINQSFVTLSPLLPLVCLALATAPLLLLAAWLSLRLLDWHHLLNQDMTFIEIAPPAFSDKQAAATRQLFTVLHGLGLPLTWSDKLQLHRQRYCLNIVATKATGIRFLVGAPKSAIATVKQYIISYVPDAQLTEVTDHGAAGLNSGTIIEFRQSSHFAFPLFAQGDLSQSDPMGYLTGAMTKLQPAESVTFQLVISPVRSREAEIIASQILDNEDLLNKLAVSRVHLVRTTLRALNAALMAAVSAIADLTVGSSRTINRGRQQIADHQLQVALRLKPARQMSVFEQQLTKSMQDKVAQPLYRVNIRTSITADSQSATEQRLGGVRAALSTFNVPKYQALRQRPNFPAFLRQPFDQFVFRRSLPSLFTKTASLLSASEIADLFHFPNSMAAKTENVVQSLSRPLPAPISLKNGSVVDIVLGQNLYHGQTTPIGLTSDERERHIYIVGGTGNGKTTMLMGAMIQDASKGKGFAFIDPHGDAAESLLRFIPTERVSDVVYFNPDDLARPIGLNLLELPPDLTGDDLLREKDLVTEATISVFRKIFSEEDEGGHRIEYILRNAVQTALTQPNATLFTVFDLLNDPAYRKQVVTRLKDKDLKNFWQHEIGKAGNFQRVKMAAGITAKIGRFLFSASAKRILEQPRSTIDFDDIINSGKILICNFSKGLIGEDTSELFGITVLAKIQLAALRRARIKQQDRQPFYLYVDEFQNFATTSFVQMLSEARKYKLFMTLAEQSTSQQKDQRMVQIILANVGTVICFRSANPADEHMLLPLFSPYIEPGEMANLPSFNFYMRISAITPQPPLSGETILPPDKGSAAVARRMVEYSRHYYGRKPSLTTNPASEPKAKVKENDPGHKPENARPPRRRKVTQ